MSVRMRHTRAHSKNRRSHHALSEPSLSIDKQDGVHLRHRVSPITGKYKGVQILEIVKKESKKTKLKSEDKSKDSKIKNKEEKNKEEKSEK